MAVDACHMRSSEGGMIFIATGMTGESNLLPFAIAVASIENEQNWTWFLQMLLKAIPDMNREDVFISSDRDKGLLAAQRTVLPAAHSSFCVLHLERNVNSKFGTNIKKKLWDAARANTISAFQEAMANIKAGPKKGLEVHDYLENCKENWANAYSQLHVMTY